MIKAYSMKTLLIPALLLSLSASPALAQQTDVPARAIALTDSAATYLQKLPKGGNLKPALNQINSAIELAPEYTRAYNTKFSILLRLGDLGGAAETAVRLSQLQPDNPDGYFTGGVVLAKLGSTDRARHQMNRAMQLTEQSFSKMSKKDKGYTDLRLKRALIMYLTDQEIAGRKELDEIVKADPQHDQAKAFQYKTREEIIDLLIKQMMS
jgi:tetratricopeptide (TPR) repeat protein